MRRVLLLCGLLFCLLLCSAFAMAETDEIYVSEYGHDGNSGTIDAPLRTVSAALERLNRMRSNAPATIWLREGTYLLDSTIIITSDDRQNITFRAYPGETPVITGASELKGWVLAEREGQIVWKLPYDGSPIRALYGEDGAKQLCRWPKVGYFQAVRPYQTAEDKFDKQLALYVNPGDLPFSLKGASLRLLHWWKDELSGIRGYDPATGLIELNRPMSMTVEKGDRYFLENVLSVPLDPGEWAFDSAEGWIYYAPLPGESIADTPLYAGVLEHMVFLYGASDITFDGITFTRTNWNIPLEDRDADFAQAAYDANTAVMVFRSSDIQFLRCTFRDMGSGCIRLDVDTRDVVINRCEFERIGAQALYVHGMNSYDQSIITERIVFTNNHVNGYGLNLYNAAAVLIIHARDVEISHNEIHAGTYTAISAGWVWGSTYSVTDNIQIRNNWLYNIGQRMLSDMGAVYLLGSQPNTVVSGNVIHDVSSADYGGWGIYLDEGSASILVTNNLVYRCTAQGFHQHMGKDNKVQNNIFALNHNGQVGISGEGSFLLERNLLVGGKPYLRIINEEGSIKQRNNIMKPDGSIFVDVNMDNFALRENAELTAAGFIPWVNMAGRYEPLEGEGLFLNQ